MPIIRDGLPVIFIYITSKLELFLLILIYDMIYLYEY